MKKRSFLSLVLVLSLLLGLTACARQGDSSADGDSSAEGSADASVEEMAEEPEETDELSAFGLGYYKGVGINPYFCDNAQNQTISGLVYESLFEVNESFEAIPCLAESVTAEVRSTGTTTMKSDEDEAEEETEEDTESQTGDEETDPGTAEEAGDGSASAEAEESAGTTITTYETDVTITLRSGVTFSDGSTMDADDVVYSIECAMDSDSVYYNRLSTVTSVSQGSSTTVYLTISGANTNVAAFLDIPIVKYGTGEDLFPVGTGPYIPQRNKNGLPTKLTANTSWWQLTREYEEEVENLNSTSGSDTTMLVVKTITQPLEEIQIYAVEDSDELVFGFSSGSVSVVSTDLTGTDSLSYTGSYTVTDYATTNMIYLGCNTSEGACADQSLRAAIYRSLNRETLVSRMLAGHAEAAVLPVSPSSALYDEELAEELAYDRSTAEELCKAADPGSTLTLVVNSNSSFKVSLAKEIAQELEDAGLDVEVETLSWSKYKKALRNGDYDLYLGEVKMKGNFDLTQFIGYGGSLNYSDYYDADLSELSRLFNCASSEERTTAASDFYRELAEQAPFIPVCFKTYSLLSREGYLTSQKPTQQNLFYHFWDWSFTEAAVEASKAED
ncbi:MAG: ABC transporter substrate-binding protein [Clostridiales bacterium]|nr:ABC transporter substrate-binding protein [Clostridiales bacterium]